MSRPRLVAAVVAVLLAVAGAYTAGRIAWAPSRPAESSADVGFARDMSAHHAQAVEMGMLAYEKGSNPVVRNMGKDVALTQQAQIGMMLAWLEDWGYNPNQQDRPMTWMREPVDGNVMPGMATPEEMTRYRAAEGAQLDVLFCQFMMRHHLGGIHMVDGELQYGDERKVRDLATNMKAGQQNEINMMTDLLTRLGAKPL